MLDKKNIAIFIDSLGGGGAEKVMLNLAKVVLRLGHYAHIFCLESRRDYDIEKNIPISILYVDKNLKKIARGKYKYKSARDLETLVKEVESKVGCFNLHLSNLDPTNAVVSQCNFENVYYVLHNAMRHEIAREKKLGPIKWYKKVMAKKVMNDKDLIAVSKGVEREVGELGLIKANSVRTIYNPIDIEKIVNLSKIELDDIPNEPYLIHVGRVVKAKRHDVLLRALAFVPDIKLVLLCKDIDKVRKLAEKYRVLDRIITPGFTNNPYAWIKNAQLSVLSSDYEGLPTVILESLICGTPVVSTDCDFGPKEILLGDSSRFLSTVGDFKGLAKNITEAINKPPRLNDLTILDEVKLENAVKHYLELCN